MKNALAYAVFGLMAMSYCTSAYLSRWIGAENAPVAFMGLFLLGGATLGSLLPSSPRQRARDFDD